MSSFHGSYVRKSGDVMTGNLNIGLNSLIMNDGVNGGLIRGSNSTQAILIRNIADSLYTDLALLGAEIFESISMQATKTVDGVDVSTVEPVGSMRPWPTDTAPTGWLLCYGQAISRETYSVLFALIGTVFGVGDGSTTFNLPDLRGRVPLGQDDMGGSSANRVTDAQADSIAGNAGAENHTLSAAQMPAHTHAVYYDDIYSGSGSGGRNVAPSGGSENSGSAGSGNAHNNMQPYLTTNYIIKT